MTEDREKNLLEKISSCVKRSELEACVGEAIALAKEMEISPQKLLDFSGIQITAKQYPQGYVLASAAADGLEEKSSAYLNAGVASVRLGNLEKAEEQYRMAIKFSPNYALAYFNLGNLLVDLDRKDEAEARYSLTSRKTRRISLALEVFPSVFLSFWCRISVRPPK